MNLLEKMKAVKLPKTKWLIEDGCFGGPYKQLAVGDNLRKKFDRPQDENVMCLSEIAQKHGHDVQILTRITRADLTPDRLKVKFSPNDCVFTYGSIELLKYIQRTYKWYPGGWPERSSDWQNYNVTSFMAALGKHSIHDHYAYYTLADLVRLKDDIFTNFGDQDGNMFIRSNAGDKVIGSGVVVKKDDFDNWLKGVRCYEPDESILLLCSEPTNILAEYRCVISDGKFLTCSRYRCNFDTDEEQKEIGEDSDVAKYVNTILEECNYSPAPIFTLDVADLQGSFRVLESGGISTSGLYRCDMEKVFLEVSRKAAEEHAAFGVPVLSDEEKDAEASTLNRFKYRESDKEEQEKLLNPDLTVKELRMHNIFV